MVAQPRKAAAAGRRCEIVLSVAVAAVQAQKSDCQSHLRGALKNATLAFLISSKGRRTDARLPCGVRRSLESQLMGVYRLDPINPDHPSWRHSEEKETVWACAPTPQEARDLVAAKTGFAGYDPRGDASPWLDAAVTSCVCESTPIDLRAGDVVREDGSLVDY